MNRTRQNTGGRAPRLHYGVSATAKPRLGTAKPALHVLETMEGCHESQRTGLRIPIQSTLTKWQTFS
jgi:hypothetical protein